MQEDEVDVEHHHHRQAKKKHDTNIYEQESEPEFDNDYRLIKQIRKMLLDNLNRERIQ